MKFFRILITAVLWAIASSFLLSALIGGAIAAIGVRIDFAFGGLEVLAASFLICFVIGWYVASNIHSKK